LVVFLFFFFFSPLSKWYSSRHTTRRVSPVTQALVPVGSGSITTKQVRQTSLGQVWIALLNSCC
jgi:hypothetical protein